MKDKERVDYSRNGIEVKGKPGSNLFHQQRSKIQEKQNSPDNKADAQKNFILLQLIDKSQDKKQVKNRDKNGAGDVRPAPENRHFL